MGIGLRWSLVAVVALGLGGCHESADTSVANSVQVPATGGGTRQVFLPPTGDVTLTLTEGALATDTTVTLEVVDRPVPADVGIVSKVVRIGPTGTQLRQAATLSFANFLASLPAGTEPAALALAFLRRQGPHAEAPRPDLVLLDLNLPRCDGREVLRALKGDPALRTIPVVVLTTSAAEQDVLRAYNLHANCYITKPVDLGRFEDVVRGIEAFWLTQVRLPSRHAA